MPGSVTILALGGHRRRRRTKRRHTNSPQVDRASCHVAIGIPATDMSWAGVGLPQGSAAATGRNRWRRRGRQVRHRAAAGVSQAGVRQESVRHRGSSGGQSGRSQAGVGPPPWQQRGSVRQASATASGERLTVTHTTWDASV